MSALCQAADHAYRLVIEERIRNLWSYRQWYRTHRFADWSDLRKEDDAELRALLKLARTARKMAAPDPIDQFKGWTEAEKAYTR